MPQQKTSISTLKEKAAAHLQHAKEIQSKIKELEDERYLKIGKLVVDYQKNNWADFELSSLKNSVTSILES